MSVLVYEQNTLACDEIVGTKMCPETFEGEPGVPVRLVRQQAGTQGWAHLMDWDPPYYNRDYCPKHRPTE